MGIENAAIGSMHVLYVYEKGGESESLQLVKGGNTPTSVGNV